MKLLDSPEISKALKTLEAAAKKRGATVEHRGTGHFQIRGNWLVNYWPLAKRRTAHIAGQLSGVPHCTPDEAVAMAYSNPPPFEPDPPKPGPVPIAKLKPAKPRSGKGFGQVSHLFHMQRGLCSLCAGEMILVDLQRMQKAERKALQRSGAINIIATRDHTIPRSKARGIDHNVRAAHHGCNAMKADQLIEPYPLECYDRSPSKLPKVWLAPGVYIDMTTDPN